MNNEDRYIADPVGHRLYPSSGRLRQTRCGKSGVVWLIIFLASVSFIPKVSAQESVADSLYREAAARHNAGETEVAVALYSRVIELDSSYTDAYWNRGRLRELVEDALPDYKKVTELKPQFGGGWGSYGWSLILLENTVDGRSATRIATGLEPDEYAWWLNLGHTFLLEGRIDSAYSYYDRAIARMQAPDDLDASRSDFDLFERRGWQSEQAANASEWLADQFRSWRHPQIRSDSLWRVATTFRDSGDHAGAARSFEAAAEAERSGQRVRARDTWLSYLNAGRAYATANESTLAIRNYEASLDAFGTDTARVDHAEVLVDFVESMDLLEQDSLALTLYEQALREAEESDQNQLITRIASAAGNVLSRQLRFDEALAFHKRALEINRALNADVNVEINLGNAAWALLQLGRFPDALRYYEEALSIAQRLDRSTVARRMRDVAAVKSEIGDNRGAYDLYASALRLAQENDDRENEMVIGGNIGSVLLDWGRYDEALDWYYKVIDIARDLDDQWSVAIYLNNIGDVYARWGRIDDAIAYHEQALSNATQRNDEASASTFLNNLGSLYRGLHKYETALDYLQRSLEINRRYGRRSREGITLSTIGMVYDDMGKTTEALRYYEEAYTRAAEAGDKALMSRIDNAIGLWNASRRDYEAARKYYDRALALSESTEDRGRLVSILHNRGATYARSGRPDDATADWTRAIDELEAMRKTASFDVRRDYLQQQIGTYQLLLIHLQELDRPAEALAAMGRMQARSLEDKLVDQGPGDGDTTIVAAAGRGNVFVKSAGAVDLGPFARNQLLLNYGLASDGFVPYVVVADADGLLMATVELDSLQSAFPESDYEWRTALSRLVSEFRSLASRQVETRGAAAAAVRKRDQTSARRLEIGRLLYDALIGPIQTELENKSELIIVPDGLLAFVPFESLVLPDGSYLAEHFDIKYAQSLAVRQITLNRDYEDSRKPMLAFGGAVYESAETQQQPGNRSDAEAAVVRNTAYSTLNRGGDQSGNYSALGYASWNDLPGTLEEVNAIADIVGSSVVVTGADVSEQTVKNLSSTGDLAGYRVIHFATHGLVVPEVPELSALVLSQNQGGDEDGYLRMDEIADLRIRADFVNLSACETGLGKLYGGEGVVGLTQSFILAGANGLSVSLWQVADESTSLFMEEMYRLVADQSISYSAAIAEVKRMFIAGDFGEQYRDPYYWAPFVYYGR